MMGERCKSCGAKIIWVRDQNGTQIPLNYCRVRVYKNVLTAGWHYKEVLHTTDAQLYHISHFITCPNASQHQARGKEVQA